MGWWKQDRRLIAGYRSVWTEDDGPTRIVIIAGVTAIVQLLAVSFLARAGFSLAAAAPVGAVFGPAGVWGVAMGALLGELATGALWVRIAFIPIGALASAFVARTLWLHLAYPHRRRPGAAAAAIVLVAVVGTLLGTGLTTLGTTLVGDGGIAAPLPSVLGERLVVTAILAPLLIVAGDRWGDTPVTGLTVPPVRWIAAVVATGAIAIGWLTGATLLDLVRADVRSNPDVQAEMARRLPPVLEQILLFASGPHGWLLQVLFALAALVAVAAVIVRVVGVSVPFPWPHRPSRPRGTDR